MDEIKKYDIWIDRIYRKWHQFLKSYWSFYIKLKCRLFGIEYGKKCEFWGNMILKKFPGSYIKMGNYCQFRSAVWSNLVGLNRPCIIATLSSKAKIIIGDNCGFSGTVIAAQEYIEIGDGTMCGGNVTITDTDWHPVDPIDRKCNKKAASAPVIIGSNVWLGLNVIILKGVRIGDNSVIGAGSIVTSDIPSNVIAAGCPARVIKKL